MKTVRVGIIGLGMGSHHVVGYQSHPAAAVVAIADINQGRLAEIGDKYHVANRYTTAEEMLKKEKLDVVSVATPNKFHASLTIAALEAGCHVLCEKPMAMNASEARQMLAVARRTGKRIMINFSQRFHETSRILKRQVQAGSIGEVYFARTIYHRRCGLPVLGGWFSNKSLSGGGPLIDIGVHRLDLALWLMGCPKPVWVAGNTYNHIISARAHAQGMKSDIEDMAVGMIKFENGAILEVEASWAAHIKERDWIETRLWGTKGGLVERKAESGEYEAELYLEREGDQFDMKFHPDARNAHKSMYHFIDCIVNDRAHIATGEEGVLVMQILDAIYESAKTGFPVKIAEYRKKRL